MAASLSHAQPSNVSDAKQPNADPPAKSAAGATPQAGGVASGSAPGGSETTLRPVVVKEAAGAPLGKDAIRATSTTVGRGTQAIRDVPQSLTVVTEKLIDDRNLDTLRDVLHSAAGATFLAAEGGEEDIRLRGFSLATTGDIFLDGLRDAAFYDRDTFNLDRADILRGSASMLFGRGSTGGVVNQVSKQAHTVSEREVSLTAGNYNYRRVVADLNERVGADAALRLVAMHTKADNNGAGSAIDKKGVAASFRYGIGHTDEFQASFYFLDNDNGINYGLPWIRPKKTDSGATNTVIPDLSPDAYYGMKSDYNAGRATIGTLAHIHRFASNTELKTQVRFGDYVRDQRASAIRFGTPIGYVPPPAGTPALPLADIATLSSSTPFTRGTNLKIQDLQTLQAQSDLSAKFTALGLKQHLLAGVDVARDERDVFAARSATQGGVTLVKPTTTLGTPNDGASVDEASRVLRIANDFASEALGVYVQNTAELSSAWKVIAGLRYDRMDGGYNQYAIPNNAAGPETKTSYRQAISEVSHRVGVLFQPTDRHSFHVSYGTSFNTSGDTYSYNALSANTPPEQSKNFEIGAKLDSANRQFSTRLAIFRSEKTNERNTDPDTAATRLLLSGKRHTAGVELDLSGRLTPKWEAYLSYMWMPVARVDIAASTVTTVGNRVGDRPGLSPKHSGSVWSTYQWSSTLRTGVGVNFRSRQAPADVTAPAWEAPSYATLDLMGEYKVSDRWMVRGNVTNVTDKYYADSLYRGHYVPGAGRLVQLNLSANF
ncbi:MAG: TonB-dependent siderophore receptor [Betaproteobacteria bacterium]|nr:MAG: TonB-dependent siderophore receptor [Betaproteobacteria bacterium]